MHGIVCCVQGLYFARKLNMRPPSKMGEHIRDTHRKESVDSLNPEILNEFFTTNLTGNSFLQLDSDLLYEHRYSFHFKSFTVEEVCQIVLYIRSNAVEFE